MSDSRWRFSFEWYWMLSFGIAWAHDSFFVMLGPVQVVVERDA